MIKVHLPDRLQGLLIDWNPIIHYISLKSTILVYDNLIESVTSKILSQKQGLIVLNRKDSNLSHKGRQVHMIFNSINIQICTWKELRSLIFGAISIQIIKSFQDNPRIFIIQLVKLVLVYLILRIKKYFIRPFIIPPLALVSIMHSSITISWLNLFGSDKLSVPLIVKLYIHLILINDMASLHLNILYNLKQNINLYPLLSTQWNYKVQNCTNYNQKIQMIAVERIQVRYFPPGINIVYKADNNTENKELDLYGFNPFEKDYQSYLNQLIMQQSEILSTHKQQLTQALKKIVAKYEENQFKGYQLKKSLKVHKQPLTNCMFSKYGDKFATASYDRTCKIWSTDTGNLLSTLSGHKNAVFCLDFSRFSDRQLIATGSLDHTAKIWTSAGNQLYAFKDHKSQISSVKFNPNGLYLLTTSLDNTIKIWDIEKGKLLYTLSGHQGQVIKLDQNYNGDLVLSCSFDYTSKIWDLKSKSCVRNLIGHQGEVNCCKFQYTGEVCATGSNDKSSIFWDVGSGKQLQTLRDHNGQVYDLDFNKRGNLFVTCSSDFTANVYSTNTSALLHKLQGHSGQVTRVMFNSQGNKIITTGSDGIGRIWDAQSGKNIDLIQGHTDQIFSCDINYYGNNIITCSKDNVCNIWQLKK